MHLLFLFLAVVYVALVIGVVSRLITQSFQKLDEEVAVQKKEYENLLINKKDLTEERLAIEQESLKIFTLYELTKEITQCLNEKDAFAFFKQKLQEYVPFKDCRLLDPFSSEVQDLKKEKYLIFNLQGQTERVGYLAIAGASSREADKENIMILGHQFALALRRVKLYEEIEKIAITDSLTNAHTRRYFMERFQDEVKRSKARRMKLAILMIDVDHFKQFNDRYGHLTGDQILREIGGIIKLSIREIDIAGRYGGEEFCVVLPDTDAQGAQFAAERIRKAAEQAVIKAYDTSIKATLSIGIATFPEDGQTMAELVDKADWAMYRAKKLGRNRIVTFGQYKEKD